MSSGKASSFDEQLDQVTALWWNKWNIGNSGDSGRVPNYQKGCRFFNAGPPASACDGMGKVFLFAEFNKVLKVRTMDANYKCLQVLQIKLQNNQLILAR